MESKIQRIIYKEDYPKLMQHIEKHNVVLFSSDNEGTRCMDRRRNKRRIPQARTLLSELDDALF